MPDLLHGCETMIWREKERSRLKAVQMDSLRGPLSIRRIERGMNAWITEMSGVMKGVDKSVLL